MNITVRFSPNGQIKKPWFVYVDGVMLRTKAGVGRRFSNPLAAIRAAKRSYSDAT